MTTHVIDPAESVLGIAPAASTLAGRVNEVAKTVVFWSIMAVGFVFPLVGAVVAAVRHHVF